MQLSKRPASVAVISCAKEQTVMLFVPRWLDYSLASSNRRGVTAWQRMSFQNVTNCIKSKSFEEGETIFRGAFKYITSSFVSLTEERFSEHQNSVAQIILLSYKSILTCAVAVNYCDFTRRWKVLSDSSLCRPQYVFFKQKNVLSPLAFGKIF